MLWVLFDAQDLLGHSVPIVESRDGVSGTLEQRQVTAELGTFKLHDMPF